MTMTITSVNQSASEAMQAKISKLITDDGLVIEKHTVFDIKNAKGEHIACIYFEAKYVKFDEEYRQYCNSFPGITELIRSGYKSNKL